MDDFYVGQKGIGGCITPGIRLWSNGLPLKADTYKTCTNACAYCYVRSSLAGMMARSGVRYNPRIARMMSVAESGALFERAYRESRGWMLWAIRGKYFLELGTLGEAFQEADLQSHVTWNFLNLCRAYEMPLMINTKANLLVSDQRYFDLLATHPAPVVISMTLIGADDAAVKRMEPRAPPASERLALIRRLRDVGIPTVVYCGPFLPDVTGPHMREYVTALIEAGAIGMHIRNLYLTGSFFRVPRWQRYIEEHKAIMVRNGLVSQLSSGYLQDRIEEAREIAVGLDPDFDVVGMKNYALELVPDHGKLRMDRLPKRYKDAVIDFTAIPLLRAIYARKDESQMLLWSRMGYDAPSVRYPESVPSGSGGVDGEGRWLRAGCYGTVMGKVSRGGASGWASGETWATQSLWSGVDGKCGFIGQQKLVYPVINADGPAEENGKPIYAYVPADQYPELHAAKAVPARTALTFRVTERPKGTEDKFQDVEPYAWVRP